MCTNNTTVLMYRHVYKYHRSVVMYPLNSCQLGLLPKRFKTEHNLSAYLINFEEILNFKF